VESLDVEEAITQKEWETDSDDDEEDEEVELSAADREGLDESIWPVQMLLVKVSLLHDKNQ
jgi:hypothetical protein